MLIYFYSVVTHNLFTWSRGQCTWGLELHVSWMQFWCLSGWHHFAELEWELCCSFSGFLYHCRSLYSWICLRSSGTQHGVRALCFLWAQLCISQWCEDFGILLTGPEQVIVLELAEPLLCIKNLGVLSKTVCKQTKSEAFYARLARGSL